MCGTLIKLLGDDVRGVVASGVALQGNCGTPVTEGCEPAAHACREGDEARTIALGGEGGGGGGGGGDMEWGVVEGRGGVGGGGGACGGQGEKGGEDIK